jgi:hypothetical protein
MFEALKAQNGQGWPEFALIVLPSRLFRTFSVKSLHLILPGPMAQAITFRAFGAGKRALTQALNCWAIVSRPLRGLWLIVREQGPPANAGGSDVPPVVSGSAIGGAS